MASTLENPSKDDLLLLFGFARWRMSGKGNVYQTESFDWRLFSYGMVEKISTWNGIRWKCDTAWNVLRHFHLMTFLWSVSFSNAGYLASKNIQYFIERELKEKVANY